jgi:RecA-family ATPase
MLTQGSSAVVISFNRPQKQFAADRAAVEKLVSVLFRYANPDTFISLRAFDDIDDNRPALFIDAISLGSATLIDRVCDRIAETANYEKPHVFCPPLCTFKTGNGATEKDLAEGICLSVECDASPNDARAKLTKILGQPTATVISGGTWANPETGEVEDRLHLHWRLKEPVVDADGFEQLKKARRLAAKLVGSDHSSITIVHPLRWPGSWHRKAQPKLARIEANPDAEIELSFALECLQELQPQAAQEDTTGHHSGQAQASLHEIEAALAALPNANLDWDEWNRIGMATWNATGGCGFNAFDMWSRKSPKYNAANTAARWKHYSTSPPDRIGAGTIFYEADRQAPGWRDQKTEEKEDTTNSGEEAAREQQAKTKSDDEADDLEPLPFIELVDDPPPREWFVLNRIPANNITLFSGDGAAGKSLAFLQLAAATSLGRDWLGTLPKPGPVIYLSFEDDGDEINRRLADIARHYGVTVSDIKINLKVVSIVDDDVSFATFNRDGIPDPTRFFRRVQNDVEQIKPVLIGIDTVTDIYRGSELDRGQVKQFLKLLRKLKTTIVLLSHPSLSGIASGSGLSGTTGWHNTVRARMYLKSANEEKDKNKEDDDSDLRVIESKKNNYGPVSERILVRWKDGVYVLEPGEGSLERLAKEQATDHLFITLLRQFKSQGRTVSPNPSPSYAPAVFAEHPDAKKAKVKSKDFTNAMERLFHSGKIKVVKEGPPSKQRDRIVEAEG